MKLTEFKQKLRVGAKVSTQLYRYDTATGTPFLATDYGIREVAHTQRNSYAFATMVKGEIKKSWADWPKADKIEQLQDGKVKVSFDHGYFLYDFNPA